MTEDRKIWIGRDGQRFGPYDDATLRAWVAEGKVEATALAWYEGMAEWRPLHEVLGLAVPPPMAGYPAGLPDAGRGSLPEPPSLHWGLLLLFTILTLGILGIVWPFLQANWVKKIDPNSKATTYLTVALCLVGVSWVISFSQIMGHMATPGASVGPALGFAGLNFIIAIAQLVFMYMAYFGMARSMREQLPKYGLRPDIGGVTLFFFTLLYLQGQMTWVSRWRQTGQTEPPAPKAIFWFIWFIPILLVIAITFTYGRH
jgi:hypothetical protein